MTKRVKACPLCGNVAMYTCLHLETDEVETVYMPIERALELARIALNVAEGEVAYRRDAVKRIESLIAVSDLKTSEKNERIGPTEATVVYQTCDGCKYHLSRIVCTGRDPQYSHDCDHPEVAERYPGIAGTARYIGTTDRTPQWCPVSGLTASEE